MRNFFLFISLFIFLAGGLLKPSYAIVQNEYEKLFVEITGMEDNIEKINELISLALIYRYIDNDTALLCCDLAIDLSQKIQYQKGEAEAYHKKSIIYNRIGLYQNATECAQIALHIAEILQDTMFIAKVHYAIGNLKKKTGIKQSAMSHFKKALEIYLEKKDSAKAVIVYSGIGNYYLNIAAYDSAVIYFHKYLDFVDPETNQKNVAKIFGNLGKVYRLLGDYENSRKYLEKALKSNQETKDFIGLATIYSKFGSLEIELVNYSKALDYYNLADSIYRKYENAEGINNCHVNKAILFRYQGKYELSQKKFDSALIYYREENYLEGILAAWEGKAMVFYMQRNFDSALIYCDSCHNLATESNNLRREEEVLEIFISIYSEQKEWEKVTNTMFRLHQVEDSIYDFDRTITVADLMIKYERERDQFYILNLENKNLQRTKQRNAFLYTGLAIVVLAIYLIIFFRYRAKKNQIIAEQKITQLEEEKKLLAARFLVEGQENERKRIATAIHDSLGVLLSTSKMHLSAIKVSNKENKILIDKATRYLDEASGEMRKISHNMMPGLLSKLGLCEALEDLFETLNEMDGIDARMEVVGPKKRLPENKEIMIYRVAQEMVNNTIKHANADKIDLTLIVHPDQLDVSYSDNGKGFIVAEVLAQKTMGVQSIRSRVKFLDGIINIDSSPGNGTIYRINVPLDPEPPLTSV